MAHKLVLNDDELGTVKGGVSELRRVAFEQWKTTEGAERDFYSRRVDEFDSLLQKLDRCLIADTSQDAEEEEDEDDRHL